MDDRVFLKLSNFSSSSAAEQNLCFVNAAFQSLYALPWFSDFFLNLSQSYLVDKPVAREIVMVIRKGSVGTNVSLSNLRIIVGQSVGKVYNGDQEDSCEFLINLLKALEKEGMHSFTNKFKSVKEVNHRRFSTSDGKCDVCFREYKETTPEVTDCSDFLSITLPSTGLGKTICLDSMVKRKYREHSIELKCTNCCQNQHHIQPCPLTGVCRYKKGIETTELIDLPKVLIVMMPVKTGVIPVPDESLKFNMNNWTYRLRAVVNHHGPSFNSGHYTATAWNGAKYLKLDDAQPPLWRKHPDGVGDKNNYYYLYEMVQTDI